MCRKSVNPLANPKRSFLHAIRREVREGRYRRRQVLEWELSKQFTSKLNLNTDKHKFSVLYPWFPNHLSSPTFSPSSLVAHCHSTIGKLDLDSLFFFFFPVSWLIALLNGPYFLFLMKHSVNIPVSIKHINLLCIFLERTCFFQYTLKITSFRLDWFSQKWFASLFNCFSTRSTEGYVRFVWPQLSVPATRQGTSHSYFGMKANCLIVI